MRAGEIAISQVNARWGDGACNHLARLAKEVLVVRAASGTVGEDQRRLPAPSSPATALRIIGRSRRNIPQVNEVQLGNVHAQLHSRRAKEQGQITATEPIFALLAIFGCDLSSMLARFEHALEIHEALIALDEVAVDLGRDLACLQQARAINRANFAIRR